MHLNSHQTMTWILLGLSLNITACPKPLLEDIDQLEKSLVGSFSSADQSRQDSSFFDIRLEVVSIWEDRNDGPWLYVEQAAAESIDRPYRQRVYHLSDQDSILVSKIYSIQNPLRFAGDWRKDKALSGLVPDSLTLREGCNVFLRRTGKEDFVGETKRGTCSSSIRGASYATSEVEMDAYTLRSLDRGFDESGRQVWGSTNGAYLFERVLEHLE